jgi:hypothetical protein
MSDLSAGFFEKQSGRVSKNGIDDKIVVQGLVFRK